MPILTTSPVRPAQANQTGPINALSIEEFSGDVEHTVVRKSVIEPLVPLRPVRGTNTLTSFAVGKTSMQTLKPGVAPNGTPVSFNKNSVVIDTVPLARNILPTLEEFQTEYDARREIAVEQGTEIAKYRDQVFSIMAAKAAMSTANPFNGSGGVTVGYDSASQVAITAAQQADPAQLYSAIGKLMVGFEQKDVKPQQDDIVLVLRPQEYYTLLENEQLINGQYITSRGTKIDGIMQLKAWGIPVLSSNNLPSGVVSDHPMGSAYDGDFSSLIAVAFSPRAILGGETIPLQSKVWFNDLDKQHYVDSWFSFGLTTNRVEYSGALVLSS